MLWIPVLKDLKQQINKQQQHTGTDIKAWMTNANIPFSLAGMVQILSYTPGGKVALHTFLSIKIIAHLWLVSTHLYIRSFVAVELQRLVIS